MESEQVLDLPSDDQITWIFSAEVLEHKTPSREDGINSATERRYRREGARFIIDASNTLKLRRDTLATGAVFFHRFFMVQSFKDFDRWVVASTCILLAGKVEETPKQCRSIIKVANQLLTPEQMKAFGNDPKEELLSHERVLIQTIRFDLQVNHPYDHLLKFAQNLKGEKAKIEQVLQAAWTFINDSLCTTLCLQWEPQAIAVAMLYLSGKMSKFDLQSATTQTNPKRSWWRQFVGTVDIHDLESICHQVLDIYSEQEKNAKGATNQIKPQSSVEHPLQTDSTGSKSTGPSTRPSSPPPPPTLSTQHGTTPTVYAPPTQLIPTTTHYTTPSLQQSTGPQVGHAHLPSVGSIQTGHTHLQPTGAIQTGHTHLQSAGSQTGHAHLQSPLIPQVGGGGILGPSPLTGPSLSVYQSLINQSNSTNYQSAGGSTHYQPGSHQLPGGGGLGGMPPTRIGQVGGVNSRYTPIVTPSAASNFASMVTRQALAGYPTPAGVIPPGGSGRMPVPPNAVPPPPVTLHQSHHHHQSHQQQPNYHSTGGNWR